MVSGRGQNLPARKIERASKTKGWAQDKIRGGEFGRRCFFLSDRNSASFPGNCKTLEEKVSSDFVGRTFFIQQPISNLPKSQSEIPTLDIPLLTSKPDAISMVI